MLKLIKTTALRTSAVVALLATAACSHAPLAPQQNQAAYVPVTAAPTESDFLQMAADALNSMPQATPEAPADLFGRIRVGFQLSDVDNVLVDRETDWYVRHPDYLDRTFRRGERYLHYIVSELEARKMPLEIALLPVVESAFNPIAYSRARAAGLWQFIPSTGVRYGLKQNSYYDGRRDVIEATRAAMDYLQFLANEFDGDWLLAVAAYNAGELNVSRAVERNRKAGRPTDFFSLDLPRETEAYVPKLLAMRRIIEDPSRYSLEFAPIENSPYFVQVDVGGQLDLRVAAELAEMPQDELLALNPGFSRATTDPNGPHQLLLPADRQERFVTALAALPESQRVKARRHTVAKGETLASLAKRYGVSPQSIRSANALHNGKVHQGQELIIAPDSAPAAMKLAKYERPEPVAATRQADVHTVRAGETLWGIAHEHGLSAEQLAAHNGLGSSEALKAGRRLSIPAAATLASTNPPVEASQQRLMYTVRSGDTLSRIARSFRLNVNDITEWNKMDSAHELKAGQRLVLYVDDTSRSGG